MLESDPVRALTSLDAAVVAVPLGARATVSASVVGKLVELPPLLLLFTAIPRILGPSRFGDFALGFFTVTLGSACVALSGAALMSRFVAAAPREERHGLAYALGRDLLTRRVRQILALVAFGTLLSAIFPERLSASLTGVVLAALSLDLLATICFQVALGLGRTRLWSFRYAVQNSTILVSALFLTYLFGPGAAIGGLLVGSAAAFLVGTAAVLRPLREVRAAQAEVPKLPAVASRFRRLKGLSNVLTQLAHRGGVILVAVLTGSKVETGYAGLAIGTGLTATYAIWQVFTVQLPAHSEHTMHNRFAAERVLRRFAEKTELVCVALVLLAVAVLSPVASFFLGHRFNGAREAFTPAIALIPLAPLTALGSQMTTLRLRPEIEAGATAVGAVVFFAVAGAAIPVWSATGATMALLASVLTTTAVLTLCLRDAMSLRMTALGLVSVPIVLALHAVS
ncbi:MAG TPA: hypothetical protein VF872_05080 [Gaiellaceae bacterium]